MLVYFYLTYVQCISLLYYYILRMFCVTGPQFLGSLLLYAPKKQVSPFLFIEKHTRSWKAAGWLDVLWHAPFHLAPSSHLSCLPLLNMPSLGLPPHTPYLGTPILFPPEHRSVSFLPFFPRKIPIWAMKRLFSRKHAREHDMMKHKCNNYGK